MKDDAPDRKRRARALLGIVAVPKNETVSPTRQVWVATGDAIVADGAVFDTLIVVTRIDGTLRIRHAQPRTNEPGAVKLHSGATSEESSYSPSPSRSHA